MTKYTNHNARKAAKSFLAGKSFVPHTLELLASKPWLWRSLNLRRLIDRLELEHARHAGLENGFLEVSWRQFAETGVSRDFIKPTIDEGIKLGLVAVTHQGTSASGSRRDPSLYRLTYLPAKFIPAVGAAEWHAPTDEWRHVTDKPARPMIKRSGPTSGPASDGGTGPTGGPGKINFPGPTGGPEPVQQVDRAAVPDTSIPAKARAKCPVQQVVSSSISRSLSDEAAPPGPEAEAPPADDHTDDKVDPEPPVAELPPQIHHQKGNGKKIVATGEKNTPVDDEAFAAYEPIPFVRKQVDDFYPGGCAVALSRWRADDGKDRSVLPATSFFGWAKRDAKRLRVAAGSGDDRQLDRAANDG
jgi:hypothetical protein